VSPGARAPSPSVSVRTSRGLMPLLTPTASLQFAGLLMAGHWLPRGRELGSSTGTKGVTTAPVIWIASIHQPSSLNPTSKGGALPGGRRYASQPLLKPAQVWPTQRIFTRWPRNSARLKRDCTQTPSPLAPRNPGPCAWKKLNLLAPRTFPECDQTPSGKHMVSPKTVGFVVVAASPGVKWQ